MCVIVKWLQYNFLIELCTFMFIQRTTSWFCHLKFWQKLFFSLCKPHSNFNEKFHYNISWFHTIFDLTYRRWWSTISRKLKGIVFKNYYTGGAQNFAFYQSMLFEKLKCMYHGRTNFCEFSIHSHKFVTPCMYIWSFFPNVI